MSLKSVVPLNSTVRPSIEIISCRKLSRKGTNKRWQCQIYLNIAEREYPKVRNVGRRSERRFASAPTERFRNPDCGEGFPGDENAVTAQKKPLRPAKRHESDPKRGVLFGPAAADQLQEPFRTAARTPRIAVDEAQLGHTRIEQVAPLVVDFVEEIDACRSEEHTSELQSH